MKITGPWWAWLEGYWKIRTDPSKNGFSLSLLTADDPPEKKTSAQLSCRLQGLQLTHEQLSWTSCCFATPVFGGSLFIATQAELKHRSHLRQSVSDGLLGLSVDICCSKPGTASKVKSLELNVLYFILYTILCLPAAVGVSCWWPGEKTLWMKSACLRLTQLDAEVACDLDNWRWSFSPLADYTIFCQVTLQTKYINLTCITIRT